MFVRKALVAAVLGLVLPSMVKTAMAGTIGPIPDLLNTSHDLFVNLGVSDYADAGSFDFEGTTNAVIGYSPVDGSPINEPFSLIGSYDTSTGTVTGTFSATFGNEQNPSTDFVSYSPGTVDEMELAPSFSTNYGGDGDMYFLIDPPSQELFVWIDLHDGLADISPVPTTIPTPAAIYSGLVLLGLLGICSLRPRQGNV